jgi:hypothetical protein
VAGSVFPAGRLPSVFDFDLERWVGEVDPVPFGNVDANPGHAIGRASWDPHGSLEFMDDPGALATFVKERRPAGVFLD